MGIATQFKGISMSRLWEWILSMVELKKVLVSLEKSIVLQCFYLYLFLFRFCVNYFPIFISVFLSWCVNVTMIIKKQTQRFYLIDNNDGGKLLWWSRINYADKNIDNLSLEKKRNELLLLCNCCLWIDNNYFA